MTADKLQELRKLAEKVLAWDDITATEHELAGAIIELIEALAQAERDLQVCENAMKFQTAIELEDPLGKMNGLQIAKAFREQEKRREAAEMALRARD